MMQARLLEVLFDGYFHCRIATDPDPTIEVRGASGYTMALPGERELDQVIRLQSDEVAGCLREPAAGLGIRVGVTVKDVRFDGVPYERAQDALKGVPVRLLGRTKLVDGPSFQSRNNIVGSDDTMAMVVEPFELFIGSLQRMPGEPYIHAVDVLDLADEDKEAWQFDRPDAYARRFPVSFTQNDDEVKAAIHVVDQHGYFWDRRRFLERQIAQWEKEKECSAFSEKSTIEASIEAARSRIHQIEFWGERVSNKLGFKVGWKHGINKPVAAEGLFGEADLKGPWTVSYWFGGWDGDLLVGFMRGTLSFPFTPVG
jgi:hypothetical protein